MLRKELDINANEDGSYKNFTSSKYDKEMSGDEVILPVAAIDSSSESEED